MLVSSALVLAGCAESDDPEEQFPSGYGYESQEGSLV